MGKVAYRATGRYDRKSPNCNIYKAIFPEVLRLEGLRLISRNGLNSLSGLNSLNGLTTPTT